MQFMWKSKYNLALMTEKGVVTLLFMLSKNSHTPPLLVKMKGSVKEEKKQSCC